MNNLNRINRILDILDIDSRMTTGYVADFERSVENIKIENNDLKSIITRFLRKKKNNILTDLQNNKIVKVNSSIGIYTLFIPNKDNNEEFFIMSPYLENYISIENYQDLLNKQGLDIDFYISEFLISIPVINKKKFNYLIEMILDSQDIDYLEQITLYRDNSIKNIKKLVVDKQYLIKATLERQAKFSCELLEAIKNGDITRIRMLFDLQGYDYILNEHLKPYNNTRRKKLSYINDVLHAVLINSEASLIDVDALWVSIKNQIENDDFSEDIIKHYCLLVDKERYNDKQQVVRNCILYINEHIREKISLNDVSDFLGVNKSYLSSIFNREMGFSIVDYIHTRRISNSKYLLKNTDFSISEISDYVGYYDTSYFIRIFKTLEKTTPLKYREQS